MKFRLQHDPVLRWNLVALVLVLLVWAGSSWQEHVHADSSSYALGSGQAGWISCTQATPCASSATTIYVAPVTTLYRISAAVSCTASTATATAILILKYTDPSSTVQTVTLATATCTTLGVASIANMNQEAVILTGTNVQYSVTAANTPLYQARVAVYQEGMN